METKNMEMVKAQAVTALVSASQSLFFDVDKFEHAQRVARMLSTSTLIPEHFRNNIGNCVIALNYAERIKADPFMVMQNMYVVHGRPGVEGKLIIALVNQSGRFDPLQFEESKVSCTAYAKEIKSGQILRGPTIDMDMVKAEGWLSKNGSKWQTMPQIMFRYRSAAFFARTYCPEVLLGMKTVDEIEDMIDLKPQKNGTYATKPAELLGQELKDNVEAKLNALKSEGQIEPEPQPTAESPATAAPEPTVLIKCPKCGLECASERGLKKHITQSHQVKAETPTVAEAKDQGTEKKTPPASIVDWGEGEKPESEDWFMTEATKYKLELAQDTWEQVLGLYGMKGKDLNTLALGYREAFLARCKAQLDKQNTK